MEVLPAFARELVRENQPLTPALRAKLDAALEESLQPYGRPETGVPGDAIAEAPA